MTSFASWKQRWLASCWIKVREHRLLRLARTSPAAFRRNVRLTAGGVPRTFGELIQPWQAADYAALDPAWLRLAGIAGASFKTGTGSRPMPSKHKDSARANGAYPRFETGFGVTQRPGRSEPPGRPRLAPLRRAWIERPRGHSKTSDMALQIAWVLLFARRPVRGLAAAADRDQATLIWNAVFDLARLNPLICRELDFRRHAVVNRRTGSELEVISSDVSSSWGVLPDFVICDELCHWERPDLWYSLLSSSAKRPDCVLVVLTNAGIGRGWHWDAREAARTSPEWHFSSLDGPHAPWIDARALDEQRRLLPPPVYARLWENRWQHSDGEFVTLAEAEACRDPSLRYQTQGQPGRSYVAAIDYAEKHDLSVGVVLHVEPGACDFASRARIIVDRMDVVAPTVERPTPVAWVEAWMHEIARNFHRVTFIVDEYQLLGTIQRLERVYDVRRFEFRGGRGNHALALNLRKVIANREVAWYAGCGAVGCVTSRKDAGDDERTAGVTNDPQEPETPTHHSPDAHCVRDDLETELAALLFQQSPAGLCRIHHRRDGRHHDDRSFALGAACLHVVQQPPGEEWMAVTPPEEEGIGW